MPNEKEVLLETLTKSLNISEEEVTSNLYNEDGTVKDGGVDYAIGLFAKRAEEQKQAREDQLKRGLKEGASKYEKLLYDLDEELSGKQGEDLIKEIQARMSKPATPPAEPPKEPSFDMEKLQAKLDAQKEEAEKRAQALIAEKEAEWADKFAAQEKAINTDRLVKYVASKFLEMNPDLPEGKEDAHVLRFAREFATSGDFVAQGSTFVPMEGDAIKLNALDHPMTIDEMIKAQAESIYNLGAEKPGSRMAITEPARKGAGSDVTGVKFGQLRTDMDYAAEQAKILERTDLNSEMRTAMFKLLDEAWAKSRSV